MRNSNPTLASMLKNSFLWRFTLRTFSDYHLIVSLIVNVYLELLLLQCNRNASQLQELDVNNDVGVPKALEIPNRITTQIV